MVGQLSNSKLGGVVLIMLSTLLFACAPEASASAIYAKPCSPPTVEDNVYRQAPLPILNAYYLTAFTNMDFNNPENIQRYESIQYEALKLLISQTTRWSDSIDVHLENKNVRITVTYISPELVQTIILNHYLFRKNSNFVNGGFDQQILYEMEKLASRNEHIFFVSLITSWYEDAATFANPVLVKLPLQSLTMTNSANVKVIPQHDDHNLEEIIDLTHAPSYGYISYPMAVTKDLNGNKTCEFLLDKVTNTHLTLSMPYIEVNNTKYEAGSWMIEYAPLLNIALNSNSSISSYQVERNPAHFSPNKELPLWMPSENVDYWEKLSRFIWYETTLDL